jgi:hypothetical protein
MTTIKLSTITAALLVLAACGGTVKSQLDGETDGTEDPPPADLETDVSPDAEEDATPEDAVEDAVDDAVSDPPPDGGCELVQIPFEAEDMTLDSGFGTETSSREHIGQFIEAVAWDSRGQASIELEIPCDDTYVLWGLAWWEQMESDSFYWSWDSVPSDPPVWDLMQQGCSPSIGRDWYWDQVSSRIETGYCGDPEEDPALMDLTAGTHTFYLFTRERMSAVAEFILTNDLAFTPPPPG